MKRKSKHLNRTVLALLLCAAMVVSATAAGSNILRVFVHGQELEMTDVNGKEVDAYLEDGTTYVPARAISEALGLDVGCDKASGTVSIDGFAPYYRTSNDYDVIPITMSMQAGFQEYEPWTSGMQTIHAGIGYIDPFGEGSYHAGIGYDEAEDYPLDAYFSDWFMANFSTSLFCIYHMADGDIYAWDGIFGAMLEDSGEAGSQAQRQDALINIVVGGTGDFEGATGILVGRTLGAGEYSVVGQRPDGGDYTLPLGLLKLMSGYIKVPASSPVAEYGFDLIKG